MWIDDDILKRCAEPMALSCFVPQSPCVVLGASNSAEVEVNVERCAADGVPILKRYGGGGTVLLSDKVVVVSLGTWVRQHFQNKFYFERLNQAVIDALAAHWPVFGELGQAGLSDIVWKERKVAGTSLFRSRNYLLYQASILIDADIAAFERYLKHPSREPDYRRGRRHGDFLSGLSCIESNLDAARCVAALNNDFKAVLSEQLRDELIAPDATQWANLLKRAGG
jgi:lipoate-protein ligase A